MQVVTQAQLGPHNPGLQNTDKTEANIKELTNDVGEVWVSKPRLLSVPPTETF